MFTTLQCVCTHNSTLDASYVSTLSWYFIVMFGIRGILQLFLGEGSGECVWVSQLPLPPRTPALLHAHLTLLLPPPCLPAQ